MNFPVAEQSSQLVKYQAMQTDAKMAIELVTVRSYSRQIYETR
jgi:hypothetical protein